MARYFDVHPENPQHRYVTQACDIIRDGGLVAYPTDAGFALGCSLGNRDGLERIGQIRKLDSHHHFTLMCDTFAQFGEFVQMNNSEFRMLKASTPGPYTFILRATREAPRVMVHPKKKTVGIRLSDHITARALINDMGEPLMTSTLILPDTDEVVSQGWQVEDELGHLVDAILDSGDCGDGPTTVIDFSSGEAVIAREGIGELDLFL